MLNGLDVFSGIGGISKALENWVRPIAYCENDRYAQAVLLSRMLKGSVPTAPIWDTVESLSFKLLPTIDIIYGGFPCQDISVAGHGAGLAGKRSGLFYEIVRLTKEVRPTFVFLENVPAIRTRGLREVVRAFTDIGYDCRWTCVSAAEVGASHLRKRWFLLAYTDSGNVREQSWRSTRQDREGPTFPRHDGEKESLADSSSTRLEGHGVSFRRPVQHPEPSVSNWWTTEPSICRVVNGLSNRSHRIKSLGNSVVPAQVKEAFERLIGLK